MAKLILPGHLVKELQSVKSKKTVIRTGLNAPMSAMKKLTVPERCRDEYTKLAENSDWYSKNMIGFIEFVNDVVFAKIQRLRAAKLLKEKGLSTEGVVE